jgi:M6 family metalloprotease-like protein
MFQRKVFILIGAFLSGCVLALLVITSAQASPAAPIDIPITQPDGTTFTARQWGDEWNHGYETVEGYAILQMEDNWWVYAEPQADGTLGPALDEGRPRRVGIDRPAGLPLHLRPSTRNENPQAASVMFADGISSPEYQNTGTQKVLVLLVEYSDHPHAAGSTVAYFQNLWFGASGSVKDYYLENSYDDLSLSPVTETHGTANDGVIGWLNLGPTHPADGGLTGDEEDQIAKDALMAADPYINYASFDTNPNDGHISSWEMHIFVVVAGHEGSYNSTSPSVWAHWWFLDLITCPILDGKELGSFGAYGGYAEAGELHGEHQATIGTFAHELGHDLSMPDLYDTDGGSEGVGDWSLMGSGSWNYVSGYAGSSPSHLDAFLKSYQGWLTPTTVNGVINNRPIFQVETNALAYRLRPNPGDVDWEFFDHSGTGEYFLVENRQLTGYDAGLPGCGLLIWHIDESVSHSNDANADENHPLVGLEQADGHNDLQNEANRGDGGDPYPGALANYDFSSWTTPNSNLYSAGASAVSVHLDSTACGTSMIADLTYSIAAPGAFSKNSPEDTSINQPTNVLLNWMDSRDVTYYEYCYDSTPNGSCAGTWYPTGRISQAVVKGLSINTTFEWQVRATNSIGVTNSNTGRFYTFRTGSTAFDKYRFLPVIIKPVGSPATIPNGSFEGGHTAWEEFSIHGWEIIYPEGAGFPPIIPHSGIWEAWLGGPPDDISIIQQRVAVVSGSPYLEFYQWATSAETSCTNDRAYVAINGLDLYVRGLCVISDGHWIHTSIDLSGYIGTTITLEFRLETNNTLSSEWYIDDVKFSVSGVEP